MDEQFKPGTEEIPNLPPSAPSEPTPAPGVSNVPQDVTLAWAPSKDPEGEVVSYKVLVGTTPDKMAVFADVTVPRLRLILPHDTPPVFFWRVIAIDASGAKTAGPLWSFKAGARVPTDEPGSGESNTEPINVESNETLPAAPSTDSPTLG